MRKYVIRGLVALLLAAIGAMILALSGLDLPVWVVFVCWLLLAGAVLALQVGAERFSVKDFSVLMIGLVIGVLMSFLIKALLAGMVFTLLGEDNPQASKVINWVWGISVILFIYLSVVVAKRAASQLAIFAPQDRGSSDGKGPYRAIVDTSVIIDGRLADIAATGFVEGQMVIPRFVLKELQTIADSSDPLKRARGRRGLDVLNRIQKDPHIQVVIHEDDVQSARDVDAKLVQLAKQLDAKVFTNDYNLNKLAEFQQVQVLNINDLANALKPVVLPGEVMTVRIVREGKEVGQGVAYLDDGTMVVVNNGRDKVGQRLDVAVTSVLQKPAGRMIFAEIK